MYSLITYLNNILSDSLFIASGLIMTMQLLIFSIMIGIILGTFLAVLRYVGICKNLANTFISITRGTPVILQLSFIYFAIPPVLGIKLSILAAGIITFGLNSTAYIAEILRSGIEYLPKGQFEAAKTLQIPNFYMWKDIILPQVIKNIFPAMVSEIITLLKETALVGTIGGMDIMRKSQVLAAEQFSFFAPLCIAGGFYYICVLFIEYLGRKIEKKWLYYG